MHYGAATSPSGAGSGTATRSVSADLSGLMPGTTYHYRLVAINADGIAYGRDRTFKTLPRLKLSLGSLSTTSIAKLVAKGMKVGFGCSQHCSMSMALIVSKATAKALKLGKAATSIASGSGTLYKARSGAITIHVLKSDSSTVSKQNKLTVTLRLVGRPLSGGPAVKVTKTINLGS